MPDALRVRRNRADIMPHFHFDIHEDGKLQKDVEGVHLASIEDARREAQHILPAIAYDTIPENGDVKTLMVLVTDEDGQAVYSATLSYNGKWLKR